MAPKKKPPAPPPGPQTTGQFPVWTNNTLLAGLIVGAVFLLWNRMDSRFDKLESRMNAAEVELGKVKQRLKDGGTQDIVSALQTSQKPGEVSATMSLISAQVQLAKAQSKAPNQAKITEIAPAVVAAAQKYPEIDQSWEAMSDLANYRTASVVTPSAETIPTCESKNAVAELRHGDFGYYFHDCRLLLDQLPGKSQPLNVTSGPPGMPTGPALMGYPAHLQNVTIELGPNGISDTNIIWFFAENCRFDFKVQHKPDIKAQQLLIAALQTKEPGNGQLAL